MTPPVCGFHGILIETVKSNPMDIKELMNHMKSILALSRKLVDQLEADKHLEQPELLEVQLFNAIREYDKAVAWDNPVIVDDDGDIG
jgi:hypothetical protein